MFFFCILLFLSFWPPDAYLARYRICSPFFTDVSHFFFLTISVSPIFVFFAVTPKRREVSDRFSPFYRAMLCIRGTSHGPVSVCLSVRLSVCPSQFGVLLKRLNVGSHQQHHTIAQGSSILMPKTSAKFYRVHPLRGRQMQVGWVKIGDFRHITGYISKKVQDRRMVSIKVE